MSTKDKKRIFAADIVRRLKRKGFEAYFVGGCVRDFVRGIEPGDYDIATSARPEQVMKLFEHTEAVGAKFGVVIVVAEGYSYEVATFRSDDVYEDGRRPSRVHFVSAEHDVLRRDFTINGLLMDPETGEIFDYVGGQNDIEKKIIRAIGDPAARFNDDHLRMLRAIRFASNLDYSIDPDTEKAISVLADKITSISAERTAGELHKLLTRGGARQGFERMSQTGLLKLILPEVENMKGVSQPPQFHPEGDVWRHTLMMLEILSSETAPHTHLALAWGALLHDVGKPPTRVQDDRGVHFYGHVRLGETLAAEIAVRLRFPKELRETIVDLIHRHMMFMNVQKMRPSKLKRFLRLPNFELHLQLHRLDCLASHGMMDHYDFCSQQLRTMANELHPQRLLSGNDLMELGFAPGRIIGDILRAVEDGQLEGSISTKKDAIQYVLTNWKE